MKKETHLTLRRHGCGEKLDSQSCDLRLRSVVWNLVRQMSYYLVLKRLKSGGWAGEFGRREPKEARSTYVEAWLFGRKFDSQPYG